MVALAISLGIFLTVFSACCTVFNLSMLITLWKGGFLSPKYGGTFLFAFAHIAGGLLTTSICTFYLGPSIIAQNTFFDSLFWPKVIGTIYQAQWLEDMLLQFITAVNRLSIIVYPQSKSFFKQNTNICLIVLAYTLGSVLSVIADYVIPCCSIYAHYSGLGFFYLDNDFNASDAFIDMPINVFCATTAVICYLKIYFYVRRSNTKMATVVNKKAAEIRKNKEAKYAVQFAACTGFCILTILFFRTIPNYFPKDWMELCILITVMTLCHNIANSVVFYVFNSEVRKKHIFSTLFKSPIKTTVVATSIHLTPNQQSQAPSRSG